MAQDKIQNIEADLDNNTDYNCNNSIHPNLNKETGCSCGEISEISLSSDSAWKSYLPVIITLTLFIVGILLDFIFKPSFFTENSRLVWYVLAYLPVALPAFKQAWGAIKQKNFFNEFTLMIVATIGAFLIGEYPEAVAVMLFYTVGEMFQNSAVLKARKNIKSLLDVRPDSATVIRNGVTTVVPPKSVSIDEIIQVKAGEKAPLDGTLLSSKGSFNTSAITGESVPRTIRLGEQVLAGMVSINSVVDIRVNRKYEDSSLARVLQMVQDATTRKSKTELFIRKFARVYTPIVFALALAITVIPSFIVANYLFSDWLYRALVFLVISCPCALVISIPLSYFGGIGAASRNGILFKGANYLDMIARTNTVVIDKTGTLTEGVFQVQKRESVYYDKEKMIEIAVALESKSNHPIAKAILEYFPNIVISNSNIKKVEEIAGHGMKGFVNNKEVLAGNSKLMKLHEIQYDKKLDDIKETIVIIAIENKYAGYFVISDKVKEDAGNAIRQLKNLGVKTTMMLSGDKKSIVEDVANKLNIDLAYADLLPEDKVYHIKQLKKDRDNVVTFVGDGINDAPALAVSDVGIAMGGMGSDAAIEVADVVIQTDQPTKIATAVQIARSTRVIVIQNIVIALGIKSLIMLLGAFGIASMWEAVFADVGVSLIAILNSIRILRKDFKPTS